MDFKLNKNSLNFHVYTRPELPDTALENDFCVISDVPMVEWHLSPDDPVGIPRNDGDVWIKYTVTGRVFNLLKNSTMLVATTLAWQYVDGAWVKKSASRYQNGAWVELRPDGAVYWHGDECVEVTGGWTAKAWKMQNDATGSASATTFEIARKADSLEFTKTGTYGAVMHTANPVDLTNVKAISFKGHMSSAGRNSWVCFRVWTKLGGTYWDSNSVKVQNTTGTDTTGVHEFTLDVSDLSGGHYLGFGIYSDAHYVVLEELLLEVAE